MIERRQFLKALAVVPFAPTLLKGMTWAAPEPAVAAARGAAAYSALVPPGTILPYAGQKAPPGFLACDGRPVPQALYPGLYGAIGGAYGVRRRFRLRHFCVPDLRAGVYRPAAALALDKKLKAAKNPNPVYDLPDFQWVIRT